MVSTSKFFLASRAPCRDAYCDFVCFVIHRMFRWDVIRDLGVNALAENPYSRSQTFLVMGITPRWRRLVDETSQRPILGQICADWFYNMWRSSSRGRQCACARGNKGGKSTTSLTWGDATTWLILMNAELINAIHYDVITCASFVLIDSGIFVWWEVEDDHFIFLTITARNSVELTCWDYLITTDMSR